MALTSIEIVRLKIGDTETSPFYPLLSDEEIQYFLDANGGNVTTASVEAAYACLMQVIAIPVREKSGEIEVWNNISKEYINALKLIISSTPAVIFGSGIMPYAAGISWEDIRANVSNADNVIPKLVQVSSGFKTTQVLDVDSGEYITISSNYTDCDC